MRKAVSWTPLSRFASSSARSGSSMASLVSRKVPEVHADAVRRAEVEMCLHGFFRVHVNVAHEPAGFVSTNGQECQVDLSQSSAHIGKVWRVPAVAGKEETFVVDVDDEVAPQSARLRSNGVRAEKCWAGVIVTARCGVRLLPPVEFFHALVSGFLAIRPLRSGVTIIGSKRLRMYRRRSPNRSGRSGCD